MSSRCLYDMSSRLLKDDFSVTIFLLPRRLQDVFGRHLQDLYVLEGEKLLRWRLVEDKTSSKPTKICWDKASEMHIVFFFTQVNSKDKKRTYKKKASQHSDILIKIIKKNLDTFADFLCTNISNFFKSSLFPSCLKMAYVTALHKECKKDLIRN